MQAINYQVSDFRDVVALFKKYGVESIRNGETSNQISELAKIMAFSDSKITEYSAEEIFPRNYSNCEREVKRHFSFDDEIYESEFDDVLALWLYISYKMGLIISQGERIKVYFNNDRFTIQVVKSHYSQRITVDEGCYTKLSRSGKLEIDSMNQIKEVYETIRSSKLITEVKINRRIF